MPHHSVLCATPSQVVARSIADSAAGADVHWAASWSQALLSLSSRSFSVVVAEARLTDIVTSATDTPIVAVGDAGDRRFALLHGATAFVARDTGCDAVTRQVESLLRLAARLTRPPRRRGTARFSLECVSPGTLLAVLGMERRTAVLSSKLRTGDDAELFLEDGCVLAARLGGRLVPAEYVVRPWFDGKTDEIAIAPSAASGLADGSETAGGLAQRVARDLDERARERAA